MIKWNKERKWELKRKDGVMKEKIEEGKEGLTDVVKKERCKKGKEGRIKKNWVVKNDKRKGGRKERGIKERKGGVMKGKK